MKKYKTNLKMKQTPKDVAINEIKKRVVTVEKAKIEFKKWIDEGLLIEVFSDEVIEFWIEVKKEVDKID